MCTILVVDDDPQVLRLVVRMLEADDVTVHGAPTAEGALLVLPKASPDLLVADVRLTGVDGLELIRIARGICPEIRSIVITGHPSAETRERAEALEASHFLVKPDGLDHLRGIARQLLRLDGAEEPTPPDEGQCRSTLPP